ncbi:MAG: SRPBCC domain-containing protein [Roseovarius sp.]
MADVHLTRTFKTTLARLFEVVTQEANILQWFGFDGMVFPDHQMDLGRTGPWHLQMRGADGARYKLSGQVTRVQAPHSVSFTWGWHDEADQRGAESRVTFTLLDLGDGRVRFDIDHRDLSSDEAATRHEQGWTMGALLRLERLMASEDT